MEAVGTTAASPTKVCTPVTTSAIASSRGPQAEPVLLRLGWRCRPADRRQKDPRGAATPDAWAELAGVAWMTLESLESMTGIETIEALRALHSWLGEIGPAIR